ncbi:hypothetical protein [Amphibacillus cookii]|uniref:hypothetical protein n=1 Tax=Amphibacillus cookii TaxID=767787 RepID=UPI00195EA1A4|nr:hypothetical protein [Amphibacillus cookii]MBM7542203.1 hypothetical protein [Amphibacillus cookii]
MTLVSPSSQLNYHVFEAVPAARETLRLPRCLPCAWESESEYISSAVQASFCQSFNDVEMKIKRLLET